ncbi:phosphotransferase enzyme family protein [Besnoitia besnoiti]|uniref:Phosphotransferase enzyme family protein n=1 Tax=Besnoitia besnoiti TaxID=94643 RepID=A0A2A9MIQ2_BESBE|nr:phosphotransferase enzyme family protein [Besnoitia besnoiti]PFH36131.1 phosphotransferase enzyme family protein [Besnoitia besnoiti]
MENAVFIGSMPLGKQLGSQPFFRGSRVSLCGQAPAPPTRALLIRRTAILGLVLSCFVARPRASSWHEINASNAFPRVFTIFAAATGAESGSSPGDGSLAAGGGAQAPDPQQILKLVTEKPTEERPLPEDNQARLKDPSDVGDGSDSGLGASAHPRRQFSAAKLQALARCCLKVWDGLPAAAVTVSPLFGGLSNMLFVADADVPAAAAEDEGHPRESDGRKRRQSETQFTYSRDECPCSADDPSKTSQNWDAASAPRRVLIRIYGHTGEELFDASEERHVFKQLGQLGIAPKCLAEFPGGRIEEWIYGRSLTPADLQNDEVQRKLAVLLGDFHQVILPRWSTVRSSNCRWSRQLPAVASKFHEEELERFKTFSRTQCECVFCRIYLWSEFATKGPAAQIARVSQVPPLAASIFQGERTGRPQEGAAPAARGGLGALLSVAERSRFDALGLVAYYQREAEKLENVMLDRMAAELAPTHLETVYGSLDRWMLLSGASPVLAHNDVQENNVMMTTDGKLRFIDFEYSGKNLRSFDIGNLFREMTINYTAAPEYPFFSVNLLDYPSLRVRRHFIAHYLAHLLRAHFPASTGLRGTLTKAIVEHFEVMVELAGLASDLQWAFWSLSKMQTAEPEGEFSHIQYALTRLAMYEQKKDELIRRGVLHGRT